MKTVRCLVLMLIVSAVGCEDMIQWSSLAQQCRHHDLVKILEPRMEKGEHLSSGALLLLGQAYYELREYDKMLVIADALEKNIAQGDTTFLRGMAGDITVGPLLYHAAVHLETAQYETAIAEATKALVMLQKQNPAKEPFYQYLTVRIVGGLGIALAITGHPNEAHQAVDTLEKVNIAGTFVGPEKYIAIARIYMANKEYDKALAAIRNPSAGIPPNLQELVDKGTIRVTIFDLPKVFILTKSLYETGHIQEAKQGYDQLLKHPRISEMGGIYWLVLFDRARIARGEGKPAEAIEFLKKAIEVIEQQRATINTEAGRIGFVGDKQAVYQELVSILLAERREADAFEFVERAKARALVDLLASQKDIAVRARNADQVKSRLTDLAKAESGLSILTEPAGKEGAGRTRSVAISLKQDLVAEAPELASLVTVTSTPVKEIQARLLLDETLLEYYSTGNDWFVFVLTREGIKAVKLPGTDIENNAAEFRAALTRRSSSDYALWSQRLYEQLFRPVSDLVRTKKLVIVPHGVLHYVPFNALGGGKDYLIDRYALRVLPSASVVKYLKGREMKKGEAVLVLGNPDLGNPNLDLRFAQDEAQAISKIMPNTKVLLRGEATESFLKAEGNQFKVIHFATHGVFNVGKPLSSALFLAKDDENDGILKVADLYNLTLDADLVTLSACETALGKVSNGDDVVGFTRGLLYAGADSIVSSLWKVDDQATRDLMTDFYTNLSKEDKEDALREAQLTVKKQYQHPFYWAAFELTGSGQ